MGVKAPASGDQGTRSAALKRVVSWCRKAFRIRFVSVGNKRLIKRFFRSGASRRNAKLQQLPDDPFEGNLRAKRMR